MNIPKHIDTLYFKGSNAASFERLVKWAYSRLEGKDPEWNGDDFIHTLEILGANKPHSELQYWIKKGVIIPTLKPDYYIFGNTTLYYFLIAKYFNNLKVYDDLIDDCSIEPWATILCHLIHIQEDENDYSVVKALTRIIPNRDGEFDNAYLKNSEKFLGDYYEKLPTSSRLRLRNDLEKSFQYFPQRKQGSIAIFKIHLSSASAGKLAVRNVTNNIQGSKHLINLPYSKAELPSILKLINEGKSSIDNFSEDMINLETADLARDNIIAENYLELVGKKLYDVIFFSNLIPEFIVARKKEEPVILVLLFDPSDVFLSQFPWELMFDGVIPLAVSNKEVYLIRSLANEISNDYPQFGESFLSPLKVLSAHPRPIGAVNLPKPEKEILTKLNEKPWFEWQEIHSPHWKSLLDVMQFKSLTFNVFHFDGHGSFGKLCTNCQTINSPLASNCKKCKSDIENLIPLGYLDFEDDKKNIDRVQVKELKVLFTNSGFRMGVISACQSAEVDGISVFTGIAPGLIQSGFKAVIGMQGSPTVKAAANFLDAFYNTLASGYPIYQAATSGRRGIYREKPDSWFMPVLYMQESAINSITLGNSADRRMK